MTEEAAIQKLKDIRKLHHADPEVAHIESDEVLLEYLLANDAGKLARAFMEARRKGGFWYA